MKLARILCFLLAGFCLGGCAAAGLTVAEAGAGVGMTTGLEHSLNGIVYKTFTAPLNNVRFATLKSLDRMAMPVTKDERTSAGWQLTATAADRTIDIEFERITSEVTRMRVVANMGAIIFKDSSTATEIILQTAQSLRDDTPATGATARAPVPARPAAKKSAL